MFCGTPLCEVILVRLGHQQKAVWKEACMCVLVWIRRPCEGWEPKTKWHGSREDPHPLRGFRKHRRSNERHIGGLGWLLAGKCVHNRVLLGSFGPHKNPHNKPRKRRIEECWVWVCGGTGNCGALQRLAPPVYTSAFGLCSAEGLLKACQCSWPAVASSHIRKKGRRWMAGAMESK